MVGCGGMFGAVVGSFALGVCFCFCGLWVLGGVWIRVIALRVSFVGVVSVYGCY